MPPLYPDLVVTANRHAVCTQVARWFIHDLRNPTQALTLLTGMMDGSGEFQMAETLREATAHVGRSLALLDRLLALAPPGQVSHPISILDSLRTVAAFYQVHHPSVVLDIEAVRETPLPAVRGVAHDLELVFLNLVLNSLEALRGRPDGRIVVTATHTGTIVRVTVADNGPGIAPALEPHLFEPGMSGWSTGEFPGLGLAASRIVAERHGWTLRFAGSGTPGARFELNLPTIG